MMEKEYGNLSSLYYQHSKPVGLSFSGDIEYYIEKLKNVDGPVLEAGVGTGRLLIPLLEEELDVDGVDNSPHMLELCKLNLKEYGLSTNLYLQDLTKLDLDKKYETIVMPTGTFNILERDKVLEVLNKFFDHLSVNGEIIIDIEMPKNFKPYKISNTYVNISETESIQLESENFDIDWINQTTTSINLYQLYDGKDFIKEEVAEFVLYWYGINEFKELLKKADFKDISYEIGYGTHYEDVVTFIAIK